MKPTNAIVITFLTLVTVAIACTKGGELDTVNGDVYIITGNADSKQLVPSFDTVSTGSFTGRYDVAASNLTYTMAWDSLWANSKKDTLTGIKFFAPAQPGANGVLIRSVSVSNNNYDGKITLGLAGYAGFNKEQYALLLEGKMYYIITTAKFPNGIVRGQLEATKQ